MSCILNEHPNPDAVAKVTQMLDVINAIRACATDPEILDFTELSSTKGMIQLIAIRLSLHTVNRAVALGFVLMGIAVPTELCE